VSAPLAKQRGGVIGATVFAVVGVAILFGLGIWQLERRTWKENLIATVTARLARAPEDLPPSASWPRLTPEADEYRRVRFPAEFLKGDEALVYSAGSAFRPDVQGAGYWVFAPARLSGGSIVLVDRGYVPPERKDPASRAQGAPHGTVEVVGVMRWPEARGLFTPADDPKSNVWFLRDPKAMAAAKKWDSAAPFYIEQEAPVPPGGLPLPGKLAVNLPDSHLQYAITWFGLALGLAGVYMVWLAGRIRQRV
jgi:surfeit locus 1 family protein